jgi:hypothetical protein
VITACLPRFLRLAHRLTERELREYLRAALLYRNSKGEQHAEAFGGVIDWRKPLEGQSVFGIVCTVDRLEQWRKTRATSKVVRPRRMLTDAPPPLPLSDAERAAAEALRAQYADVAREDETVAVKVYRAGR